MAQGSSKVTTPSDTEVVITREFDAPRELVFEAYTKPEHLKRWMGAQGGWSLDTCEVDLRTGGAYRYVWKGPNGETMGMGGTFLEVKPPALLRADEKFDDSWYPGPGAISTVKFTERNGKTVLEMTIRYGSKEARDISLETGVEGVKAGLEILGGLLTELKGARR